MKGSGRSSQAGDIRAPERRCAVPFPQWGRQRGGGFAAQKRKPTPPRYARQPLPREGARVDAPSYGRRCLEGAEVGWRKRDEKEREDRLKSTIYESTLSTAARSPFPKGEGCDTRMPLFSHRQSEYTHMWKKNIDGQSLPRVGKVASEASRIGY